MSDTREVYEYTDLLGAKTNIGGFYRQWTCDGLSTKSNQAKRLETLLHQFDLVTENCKRVIMLGDANISLKQIKKDSPLKNKRVTELLMNKSAKTLKSAKGLAKKFAKELPI